MFTKAMVRPPAANFCEGLTTAGLGAPNYLQALEQHSAYCAALEYCGVQLIRLEADDLYPDSCFVEDAALIVGRAIDTAAEGVRVSLGQSAIITRPGASSRRGEVVSIRDALLDFFPAIGEIQAPGTLDGGDICEAGKHVLIGISERTNEDGGQQLTEILTTCGFTCNLVETNGIKGLLHLKSGLAYLGKNNLVVTQALAHREGFSGYKLICVDPGDEYAANCLEVNGRVLIAAGYPRFEAKLRGLGYETITLEVSEFRKMDGGLSCLSLRW